MSRSTTADTVHFETRGRGRTLVFLHASPSDHARAMALLEPAFVGRSGWKRVYPDLPGHGRSARSDRIRDMDDYLDRLLEFVDRISDGRTFAIGGVSFGAYFALAIARRRTGRVDGLMLSVPEIHHDPSEERRDRAWGTPSVQTPRPWSDALPPYVEDTEWLESLAFRDVSVPLYRTKPAFRAPALFLLGRQDAPFRYQAYARLLDGFPHASLAVLDGAGHHLWLQRAELARALVHDWLGRVENYARSRKSGPAEE